MPGSASAWRRSTCSTYFCDTRCGSSAALHDPPSVATLARASRAEGSRKRASSCVAKRVKYAMSVGKSSGSPRLRTSSANPSRRKCSIVRAWVAFACGFSAVDGLASKRSAVTPRRPSSFASIRPKGPPPAISTSTTVQAAYARNPAGRQLAARPGCSPPHPCGGLGRRRDRVVGLEEVARVIERLDLAQALPGGGLVEGARVGRLLHEVRVVAGLEALRGELDGRQ